MKLATKVKDEAEVNFDKELPDNKHFEDYCELLRFDADKLFKICKLLTNFVQNLCKHGQSNTPRLYFRIE